MLSKGSLRAISRIFRYGCTFKVLPFVWDSDKFKLTVIRDARILFPLIIAAWIWYNFLHMSLTYFLYKRLMSPTARALHVIWWISGGMSCGSTVNTFRRRHQISSFLNRFFRFQKYLQGNKCHISCYYKIIVGMYLNKDIWQYVLSFSNVIYIISLSYSIM
jgi:hypothetical protein